MVKKASKESQSILEFIQSDIKDNSSGDFDDILKKMIFKLEHDTTGDSIPDKSTRGFYYERIWDICIKFNLVTDLTDNNTTHFNNNANIVRVEKNLNYWNTFKSSKGNSGFEAYLSESVRSGSSGGYSDITFLNTNDDDDIEDLYLISVKYYENEKGIDKYDIGKLCSLIDKQKKKNRNIHIYLFVKNKVKAIENFKKQNQSSDVLIQYINPNGNYENILDETDLRKYYFKLRILLEQYNWFSTKKDISKFKNEYLKTLKPLFIPRFHQKLFIDKIDELLIEKKKPNVLVGALPRTGKSYIMAGTILNYVKKYFTSTYLNFLIITPAPNETFTEYTDIFNNYLDFEKFNIRPIIFEKKTNVGDMDFNQHNVIIVSKQTLGWSEPGTEIEDKSEDIKSRINVRFGSIKSKINIMFNDEVHFGMTTEKAIQISNILQEFGKIPTVYVTATYNKPLKIFNIDNECKLTWDINDINIMKNLKTKPPLLKKKELNKYIDSVVNDIKTRKKEKKILKQKLEKDSSQKNRKLLYKKLEKKYSEPRYIKNNKIRDKFGAKIYDDTLKFFGDSKGVNVVDDLIKKYSQYPKPHLITSLWHKDKLNIEKSKIGDTEYGFDMSKLFLTKHKSFENPEQVKELLRYYFGKSTKEMNYEERDFYNKSGIIPRIKNLCRGRCRTMQEGHMTSQLWFLPTGGIGKIEDRITALLEILMNTYEFKNLNYHYFVANSNFKDKKGLDKTNNRVTYLRKTSNIKIEIEELEKKLKGTSTDEGPIGDNLIILTGEMLQLGISLKNVDIVAMWNNNTSSDAIFQKLFRSMTEIENPECIDDGFCSRKEWGFMVDLNPQRILSTVNLFSENINYQSQSSADYRQVIDLIDIDGDIINQNNDSDTERDNKINELFNKLYESWNQTTEKVKKITENFNYSVIDLKKIESELRELKLSDKERTIKDIISAPDDTIDAGAKKQKINDKEKKEVIKKIKEVNEIPIEKLAAEIIAEFISIINIFTLYFDGNTKCILLNKNEIDKNIIISDINKLKDNIYNNAKSKELFLKIMNGRLNGDESKIYSDKIIDIVLNSIKEKKDISYMEKIIFSQKKQYYGIRDPDKLLEDINNNLAPKEKERKERGEVFTHIKIVQDMVYKLPEDVWTNPYLTWLDPAVGIGNFPVIVYLKLMEGLKNYKDEKLDLTDEEERRKHILEEMLYMVEISEKSIFILNKVFCGIDGGGQYRLNIYSKSFIEKEYNPGMKYDIIMGNPPYNPPKGISGKSSGNSIWQNFVMKSFYMLTDNGYLVFVHPPGWKKPTLNVYREELFLQTNDYTKQIRQGQVWQVLKNHGAFNYIYSNDQKSKQVEYINYFPAVDYYVYQKNGDKSYCNTKSIFNGKIYESTNVKLNYDLDYLPNFITNESINILKNIVTKNIVKENFIRYRHDKGFSINEADGNYKYLYVLNSKLQKQYQYSDIYDKNIDLNKVILNWQGGIDTYYVDYIDSKDKLGVYDKILYTEVKNKTDGEKLVKLFKSNMIKFIFLITQYASGMRTVNESFVANSISIPPIDFNGDLYEFYGIKKYQKYIDEVLNDYEESVKPKARKKKEILDNSQKSKKKDKPIDISEESIEWNQPIEDNEKYVDRYNECLKKKMLWNINTHRCVKDTPTNRKKIMKDYNEIYLKKK